VVHQPVPGLRTLDSRTAPVHMLYGAVTVVCVVKEWGNIKNFHFEGNIKDTNHANSTGIINTNDINNNNSNYNVNNYTNNKNIHNNNNNNNNNNNDNNDHNHIFDDDSNSNLKIKQKENILINNNDENCIVVRVIAVQYNNPSVDIESRKRGRDSLPLFSTSNTTSAYVTLWVVDDSLTNTINHDNIENNTNYSPTDNKDYDGKEICSKKLKMMKKIIFGVPSDFFHASNSSISTFPSSSSLPPFEFVNNGNLSLSLLTLSSVRPGHLILISGIISNTTTTITTKTQKIKIPKSVVQFLSKNNCDCDMNMKNEYLKNYFFTENYMNEYSEELVEFNYCIPTFQCKLLQENDTIDASITNNDNNNNNNNYNTSLNSNSISVENEESVLGHLTNISLLSAFHCSPSLFV
jgi:hypothetical protein